MRGHDRDQLQRGYSNEYEDGEGYGYEDEEEEGDGEEEEEEEEGAGEEEDPKPTEEELAFLEMRQRLKEAARKKLKKESASVSGNSAEKKRKLPNDNYGSFFGPSQPVIARRVLEERRSVLETQHLLASKNINSHTVEKKANPSTTNAAKPNVHKQPQKAVNELKMKAQKLKDTRDYSFLLSDDAEPPAPAKEPAPRNVSAPSSDARPAQMPSKSKPSMSKPSMSKPPARPIANGHVERNKVSTNHPVQSKVGHSKVGPANRPDRPSADPRKLLGSNVGNGPGRPVGSKVPVIKAPSSVVGKKPNPGYAKNPDPVVRKVPLSRPESSSQRQHLEQRREPQKLDKPKVVPKQAVSSSKPQMRPPPKQMPSRPMHDKPSKKRPRRDADEDDDATAAISMIRKMFRYDPRKFSGDDDDLSDMEANFNDIQKEEQRSSQIAREEDERELRLIEEEERRERMRKEAKKKKLNQR